MARWPAKKLTWLDGHGQEEHEREREQTCGLPTAMAE